MPIVKFLTVLLVVNVTVPALFCNEKLMAEASASVPELIVFVVAPPPFVTTFVVPEIVRPVIVPVSQTVAAVAPVIVIWPVPKPIVLVLELFEEKKPIDIVFVPSVSVPEVRVYVPVTVIAVELVMS